MLVVVQDEEGIHKITSKDQLKDYKQKREGMFKALLANKDITRAKYNELTYSLSKITKGV